MGGRTLSRWTQVDQINTLGVGKGPNLPLLALAIPEPASQAKKSAVISWFQLISADFLIF